MEMEGMFESVAEIKVSLVQIMWSSWGILDLTHDANFRPISGTHGIFIPKYWQRLSKREYCNTTKSDSSRCPKSVLSVNVTRKIEKNAKQWIRSDYGGSMLNFLSS